MDFSSRSPLIISGRYEGHLSPSLKVSGTLSDMSTFSTDLKVLRTKYFPVDRVLVKRHIDMLTARAWLSESKELEEKVSIMSIQAGVPSEYTSMTLLRTDKGKKLLDRELTRTQEAYVKVIPRTKSMTMSHAPRDIILGSLGAGFGNVAATEENKVLVSEEPKHQSDVAEVLVKAASSCFSRILNRICCLCFIRTCNHVNNQCAAVVTQICTALCCCECLYCCYELFLLCN